MSQSADNDAPTVCIAHGAFIPCRKGGEHRYSANPYWVKSVSDYQTSTVEGLTWEPAWSRSASTARTSPGVSRNRDTPASVTPPGETRP